METRVGQLEEAQQEKALIQIVFQMKNHAKNMQQKRQDYIKMLLAKAIKQIYLSAKQKIQSQPRRFGFHPKRNVKDQQTRQRLSSLVRSKTKFLTQTGTKERLSFNSFAIGLI